MDTALPGALAPVLHDLDSCIAPVPDVRDNQWSDAPRQVAAMMHDVDGTAQGSSQMAAEPLPQRIASVADQVQEWAIEALDGPADPRPGLNAPSIRTPTRLRRRYSKTATCGSARRHAVW